MEGKRGDTKAASVARGFGAVLRASIFQAITVEFWSWGDIIFL